MNHIAEKERLIRYPQDIPEILELSDEAFVSEMRFLAAAKLYELGKLSSLRAGRRRWQICLGLSFCSACMRWACRPLICVLRRSSWKSRRRQTCLHESMGSRYIAAYFVGEN